MAEVMDQSRTAGAATYLDETTRRLFPLRLTPFESYMFLDRRPDTWMLFLIQMHMEGTVDRAALTESVAFACSRHPLSVATVESGWWGRRYWTLDKNQQPAILWTAGGAVPAEWHRPPDLTREAGVRVLVEQREGEATITLQFHHSVCDGVASGQWMEDVLAWYARLTGPEEAAPVPVEIQPERLIDRRRHRGTAYRGWEWVRQCVLQLAEFFGRIPRPLRTPAIPPPAAEQDFAGLVSHFLSLEETHELRRATQRAGVTLNDWLLRDLFKSIAAWNAADAKSWFSNPWYRVNMPTSLRERADVATPATNLVSLTFLNRRRSAVLAGNAELLDKLAKECGEIKRQRKGTMFLDTLAMIDAVPDLLRVILGLPLCLSTGVLTNLGDPCRRFTARFPRHDGFMQVGNLVVRNFGGAPTLRRNTHVAMAVNTYRNRITLNLQMTPGLFGRADVERFMKLYVEQIQAALAESKGVAT